MTTQIPWVKNPDGTQGFTWNPITGCLNGCEYCYARKLANTRLRERYLANGNIAGGFSLGYGVLSERLAHKGNPFYPRFWEDRLDEMVTRNTNMFLPHHSRKPARKGYFVCDMSDLFGIGVPDKWTERIMDTIWDNRGYDRFYLLTKQPQNLIKSSSARSRITAG